MSLAAALLIDAASAAPPTLDEIIAGMEQIEGAFFRAQSMRLRYERMPCEVLIPSASTSGELPCEWTLAYRGRQWYFERRFTQSRHTKELQIPAEPEVAILDDSFLLDWTQHAHLAVISEFAGERAVHSALHYTANLALDAPKYIALASDNRDALAEMRRRHAAAVDLPYLPEFLRANRQQYRIRPEPETLDGVACWILEWPEMDEFAVAPSRGCAVVRRTYRFGPGKPLRAAIRNSDYREVRPGLWLPYRQRVDYYTHPGGDPRGLWNKVAARTEYRVHELEFNTVSDAQFEVTLPPGTKVVDDVRQFTYRVGNQDQGDPFDFPVVAGQATLRRGPYVWFWINVGLLGAILLVVGWRVWAARNR